MVMFGLCSILGVSWGFVFFAYGILRIPAYYIFTVLSSFQGTLSVMISTIGSVQEYRIKCILMFEVFCQ